MFSGGGQAIEESVWNELIKEVDENGDGQVFYFSWKVKNYIFLLDFFHWIQRNDDENEFINLN